MTYSPEVLAEALAAASRDTYRPPPLWMLSSSLRASAPPKPPTTPTTEIVTTSSSSPPVASAAAPEADLPQVPVWVLRADIRLFTMQGVEGV